MDVTLTFYEHDVAEEPVNPSYSEEEYMRSFLPRPTFDDTPLANARPNLMDLTLFYLKTRHPAAFAKLAPKVQERTKRFCCSTPFLEISEAQMKDFSWRDVKLIKHQTKVCRHEAFRALERRRGDIIETIIDLLVK
jgi:hypothetical protein